MLQEKFPEVPDSDMTALPYARAAQIEEDA